MKSWRRRLRGRMLDFSFAKIADTIVILALEF